MLACAEVAELADAPGSGPGPVHTGWRFESSLRHQLKIRGRLAQLARALRSHRRGHWFESSIAHHTEIIIPY